MKALVKALIAVAATLAFLAPAAGAAERPDDRAGARGPGAFAEPTVWLDPALAAVRISSAGSVRPDDRGTRREVPLAVPTWVPAGTDTFDWGDAGIGAGVAGVILALVLTGYLTRQTGRDVKPA